MAKFTQAELAQLDGLITHMQESEVDASKPVVLWTPVAAVVARAVVSTAAVLCARVEADAAKIAEIERIAKSLETTTTLNNLIELRRRVVKETSTMARDTRK